MAGEASAVGGDIMLDAASGRATQSLRTTYLALLTAAPSDATTVATMSEVTTPATNGYARQAVTWTAPVDAAGVRSTENTAQLTFGPFSSDLVNVTHLALVDSLAGGTGDVIWFWTADVAKDPANGDSITVAAGALTMTAD